MADDVNSLISTLDADPGPTAAPSGASGNPDTDALIKTLDSDTNPAATSAAANAPNGGPKPPTTKAPAKRPIPKMFAKVPTINANLTGQKPPPELSLGDAISQGAQNAPTSFVNQIKGAVEPLLPTNWGSDVRNATQIGKGILAKTGFIDQDNAAQATKDKALDHNIVEGYKQKYGTWSGFKAALASDPASFLTDASALATIPEGGEGLLAKLPGVGEQAASAARVIGQAGHAVNPVGMAVRGVGLVLPRTKALTATGNVTGAVKRAASAAFGDRLDPTDLDQEALKTTVAQKGATPASMKEALLRTFEPAGSDTQVPRQVVTGQSSPMGTQGPVREVINEYKGHVARAAQDIGGGEDPSDSAVGDALQSAQIDARNQYTNNYAKVAAHDGSFDPSFAASMPEWIAGGLKKANLTTEDLTNHPGYDQTAEAIPWLQNHIQGLADDNNLTPQELMKARKSLGQFSADAKGSDKYAMGSITDAFDRHIQDAADSGLYNPKDGDDIQAGKQVASDMGNAITSFKNFKNNFSNPTGTVNGSVKNAVKQFVGQERDGESGLITSPDTSGGSATAQAGLTKNIINPKTLATPPAAQQLYNKLTSVGGPDMEQALKDHIRATVTRTKPDNYGNLTLANTPDQIHQFLDGPLADTAFTPAEQARLRQIAEAQRVLTTSASRAEQGKNLVDAVTGHAARAAGSWALGHTVGGPLGGVAAGVAENMAEPMIAARGLKKQLSGAPGSNSLIYGPGRMAASIAKNPPMAAPWSTLFNGSKADAPNDDTAPDEADPADLIKSAALHHGIDPGLVARVAHQESRGNQTDKDGNVLTSPKGALGVMQLMPKTAADLGVDPTDKAQNIDGGTRYLSGLIDQFGDPAKGVAAYNAGPGAVKRAIEKYGEDWLSHLPAETQQYTGAIMASNDDGRVMRAAGGKVESEDQKVERLVNRLMTLAKSAKKMENKKTEPLLKASDNLVAKALSVAQRGI